MKTSPFILALILIAWFCTSQSLAWHDKTHLAVARAGGLKTWYNAAGPDLAKLKAGSTEGYNHYFNNNAELEITAQMVIDQVDRYNQSNKILDSDGHVLGAIIGSLQAYEKDKRSGKYAEFHLAYCAHYIADLSQPLHQLPYDSFNQSYHEISDGIVDKTILEEPHKISRHMYPITLSRDHFEEDLAREIARIANLTRKLGYKLRQENRAITKDEAYIQLGHSASLLKVVLQHYK